MRVQCPDAAEQLLELAIDASADDRSVIFFSGCPSPSGAEYCHRNKVAKLLLKAAWRCGVRIAIQEWPGGAPSRDVEPVHCVSKAQLGKLRHGARKVAITNGKQPNLSGCLGAR
jgi:hypothetical protein